MSEAENYPRSLEPQTSQSDAKPVEKERPKTSFIELVKKYGLPNEGNMDAYSQWASEQFGTPGQPTKKLTIEQVRKCYEIIANAKRKRDEARQLAQQETAAAALLQASTPSPSISITPPPQTPSDSQIHPAFLDRPPPTTQPPSRRRRLAAPTAPVAPIPPTVASLPRPAPPAPKRPRQPHPHDRVFDPNEKPSWRISSKETAERRTKAWTENRQIIRQALRQEPTCTCDVEAMLSNPSTFGDVGKRSILLVDKNDYCERMFKFCKCEFSLIANLARVGYICGSPRDPRLAFSVRLLDDFNRQSVPKTTYGKNLYDQHRRLRNNPRLPQYLTPFVRAVEQYEIVTEDSVVRFTGHY